MTSSLRNSRHVLLGLGLVGVATMVLMAGFVSANHNSGNPMTYGYVMDGGQPVENALIKQCWDASTQPDENSCFPTSANGPSDSSGHWYSQAVAGGLWTVWAEKDGTNSQVEHFVFDGTSQ